MPLPKGRPNRKQMIASALSIARKKRADGGGLLGNLPGLPGLPNPLASAPSPQGALGQAAPIPQTQGQPSFAGMPVPQQVQQALSGANAQRQQLMASQPPDTDPTAAWRNNPAIQDMMAKYNNQRQQLTASQPPDTDPLAAYRNNPAIQNVTSQYSNQRQQLAAAQPQTPEPSWMQQAQQRQGQNPSGGSGFGWSQGQPVAPQAPTNTSAQPPGANLVRGFADGGDVPSFPDMVAQNPRGWGTAPPPIPDEGSISLPPGRADRRAQFMDTFGTDPDLPPGQFLGETAKNFAWQAAPMAAMEAAGPLAGPAMSGLTTAAKYAAKGAPLALAALGASSLSAPAGESPDDMLRGLAEQKATLAQQQAEAKGRMQQWLPKNRVPDRDADPKYFLAKDEWDKLDSKISAIDKQMEPLTPAGRLKQHEAETASADARQRTELDQPFASRHPYAAPVLPFLGTALAALTSRYGLGKIAGKGDQLMEAFTAAKKSGDTLEMSDLANQLASWKRWAPVKQTAAIGVPATFPVDTRVAGDVIDRYGLPPDSKAQQAAAKRTSVENLPQYLKDNALPIMSGIAGSLGGMKWAPAAPVGDARAIASRYAGKTPAEIGQIVGEGANASIAAQGSLARLAQAQKARALLGTGDDEAARRLSAPGDVPALAGRGFSTPSPALQGGQLQATPAPRLAQPTNPVLPPPRSLGPTFRGAPPAPLLPPVGTASKAMPPVPAPLPTPEIPSSTSAPIAPASTLEQTLAAKAGEPAPAPEVIKPTVDANGNLHHPKTGNFMSAPDKAAPKPKPTKAQKQPKPKAAAQDDVPLDKNGIPIKPPKEFDPDDPINRGRKAGGGVFSHAMSLARKYAKGGAVVGALVGNTGGRADKLSTSVPAGSHVIPADVVSHYGEGNTLRGLDVMKKMFPGGASRSNGGAVPVYLSDGEYVASPEAVAARGGHDAIDRFILQSRQDHINTLANLPPPAR